SLDISQAVKTEHPTTQDNPTVDQIERRETEKSRQIELAKATTQPGAARLAMLANATKPATKPNGDWWATDQGIDAKAKELGIERLPKESSRFLLNRC